MLVALRHWHAVRRRALIHGRLKAALGLWIRDLLEIAACRLELLSTLVWRLKLLGLRNLERLSWLEDCPGVQRLRLTEPRAARSETL